MYQEKWLEDCSKPELLRRLTQFCAKTNAPAEEGKECECVAHRLIRTERAEKVASEYQVAFRAATSEAKASAERLSDCKKECAGLHAKVANTNAKVKAAEEAKAVAEANAKTALAIMADVRQAKAKQDRDYVAAAEGFASSAKELTLLKETLRSLL
jgi:hypothetical protein